jgi:hypothetical protein
VRTRVPASGWCRLELNAEETTLTARLRAGKAARVLRTRDAQPLGPGLVGLVVNAADPDAPARAEFRSFEAASTETPQRPSPEFAYRFAGAVVPAPDGTYRARLSARTVHPQPIRFELARDVRFDRSTTTEPVPPIGRFGATRAWVGGLQPGTRYFWRPVAQDGERSVRAPAASLRTPPRTGGPVRFAFASCTSGRVATYPSFAVAASLAPDFYLHAGDWGYPNLNSLAHRPDHFQARWTRLLRERNVARLLDASPLLFWQDDHDYQSDNGWAGTVKPYAVAAFDEIHANPTNDYFDLRWGDVHVFCLDCRLHADDPEAPDTERKSRLGLAQRTWLERSAARTDAPVVVVASAMPFRNKSPEDPGWHNAYTRERDRLLRLFASIDAAVVILSGDAHGHRLIHHFEFGELYEITASGTDFPDSLGWGQGNHDPGHTLVNITDRTGFAFVELDPAGPARRLTVRSIATADGAVMFEKSIPVRPSG